jgi:hypothetical protein
MTLRVHAKLPTLDRLGMGLLERRLVPGHPAAQDCLYPFHENSLREWFANEIISANLEPKQFVEFIFL